MAGMPHWRRDTDAFRHRHRMRRADPRLAFMGNILWFALIGLVVCALIEFVLV
jgi:hypothetical protein